MLYHILRFFCFSCEINVLTDTQMLMYVFLFLTDSKSQCFKRHTLNYLQEIGNGWFGKVIRFSFLYYSYSYCYY